MLNSLFPFIIEILYNIKIDEKFFLSGTTYEVHSVVHKVIDKDCDDLACQYPGIQVHYVLTLEGKNYLLPAPAVAIVPNLRDPDKAYRMKYWIDKSQGEYVRDYVLLAYQMHGVSIAAKSGLSQADFANRKVLESIYGTESHMEPGQPVKIIVPDYKAIESNLQEKQIPSELIINVVSARFYRGETLVYSLALSKQPTTNVDISIHTTVNEIQLSEEIVIFTPENFSFAQEIIVTVVSQQPITSDKIGEIIHNVSWPGESVLSKKISVLIKADR